MNRIQPPVMLSMLKHLYRFVKFSLGHLISQRYRCFGKLSMMSLFLSSRPLPIYKISLLVR
jgi:hypothetical protein